MASCAHVQWLRLIEDQKEFSLQYGSRLHYITKSLPRPSDQFPSTLSFVGKKCKMTAMRAIFPESRISRSRNCGIANICIDPMTADDSHPMLLADICSDYTEIKSRATKEDCHESTNYPLIWHENGTVPMQ